MQANMSDKEQVQVIKDWWKKNGTFIIFVIAFFLITNVAIRYYKHHKEQMQEQASTAYTQLINSQMQHKNVEVKLFADDLMKNYSRSVYAGFAAMILAKENVEQNKLDEALKNLQWVIDHSKNKDVKTIAKIRIARIFLAQNKPQEALKMAESIQDKTFAIAADEIKGDSMLEMGKQKSAVDLYKHAIAASSSTDAKSPLLNMKVND